MSGGPVVASGTPPDPARASLPDLSCWFESCLGAMLPAPEAEPRALHEAMIYACEAGKRIRPLLCLASAAACGGDLTDAVAPAAAIELVHAYSLVHDDLPAMDDDDTRRGRPTVHVRFGEPLAVLTGDALLSLAFGVLAGGVGAQAGAWADVQAHTHARVRAEARLAMVRELAMAAGSLGMVGGQAVDIAVAAGTAGISRGEAGGKAGGKAGGEAGAEATVRAGGGTEARFRDGDAATARYIAEHKTGALMRASCRLGGLAAAAPAPLLSLLTRFGATFGFAYQVLDDLGDEARDRERGASLNFAVLLGPAAAAETAARAMGAACAALEQGKWPGSVRWLQMLVEQVAGSTQPTAH